MAAETQSRNGSNASSSIYCLSCRATRGSVASDVTGLSPQSSAQPSRKGSTNGNSNSGATPFNTQRHPSLTAGQCICSLLQYVGGADGGGDARVNGTDAAGFATPQRCSRSIAVPRSLDSSALLDGGEMMMLSGAHGQMPPSPALAEFCRAVSWDKSPNFILVPAAAATRAVRNSDGEEEEDDGSIDPLSDSSNARLERLRQNVDMLSSLVTPGTTRNTTTGPHDGTGQAP